MDKFALEIENLCYRYRHDWTMAQKAMLHSISLQVRQGEAFGFLGHNGAGKTTTIKCVLNLITPTAGSVRIFGVPSSLPSSRERIGFLPEQPYFYDYLTVEEILFMYAKLAGIDRQHRDAKVAEALERVRMHTRRTNPMHTLSKGLTQRVGMAQAIIHNPELLILDEPFSGLDPIGRREFRELILDFKKNGTAIFMSSHVLNDVEHICDRASILADGKLKGIFDLKNLPSSHEFELSCSGTKEAIAQIEKLAAETHLLGDLVRMRFTSEDSAEKALSEAIKLGAQVKSFESISGSLEDLFVQIVSDSRTAE